MDIETYNCGVVSEQYFDQNGKTILWRRFNRNDWAIDRYKKHGVSSFLIMKSSRLTAQPMFNGTIASRIARFSLNRNQYAIDLEFYQNEGLFHSTALLDKLHSFKSSGMSVYGYLDALINNIILFPGIYFSCNAVSAENIEVIGGAGNGHVDFYLRFSGIPLLKQEEIESIYFSLDEEENAGKYEIEYPEYYDTSKNDILRKLKKNENDFIQTTYSIEDYIAVGFCESPSLGVVLQHFYLVKKSDLSISSDIFDKVRKFDGFNYDDLKPFAFKIGDVKNNLFFSCKSEQKTGDFYVEMDSGAVHLLAQHEN